MGCLPLAVTTQLGTDQSAIYVSMGLSPAMLLYVSIIHKILKIP